MKKTIFKGFHRPIQLPAFLSPCGFITTVKEHQIIRKVRFTDSCAYDLKNDKQGDWNKLFGICAGLLGIHRNSVRFGWRYSVEKQCIELCRIFYRNGKPSREYIPEHDIPLNKTVTLELCFSYDVNNRLWAEFLVDGASVSLEFIEDVYSAMYWGCGLYFGGKSKAPHKMTVEIVKL